LTTAFNFAEIVSLTFKKDFKVEKIEVISLTIGAVFGSVIGCLIFSFLKMDNFINPLFGELGKTVENLNARFKAVGTAFDKQNVALEAFKTALDAQVEHTAYCVNLQVQINKSFSDQLALIMGHIAPQNSGEINGESTGNSETKESNANPPNCT